MRQEFDICGEIAVVYSNFIGQLALGEVIEKCTTKLCKAAIFAAIPDKLKGKLDRKTTTPFQETIDLMLNPPMFSGNTDDKLYILRILAGNLKLFITQKIPASNDPIKIREPSVNNLKFPLSVFIIPALP